MANNISTHFHCINSRHTSLSIPLVSNLVPLYDLCEMQFPSCRSGFNCCKYLQATSIHQEFKSLLSAVPWYQISDQQISDLHTIFSRTLVH